MIRLTSWLEEKFIEQLLLGNHWLQEKNKKKAQGVKQDPEREWRDLYHDSGSCLDISNDFQSGAVNSYLQIVQVRELTSSTFTSLRAAAFSVRCVLKVDADCSSRPSLSPTARRRSILAYLPCATHTFSRRQTCMA